jgi:hypothetical protein
MPYIMHISLKPAIPLVEFFDSSPTSAFGRSGVKIGCYGDWFHENLSAHGQGLGMFVVARGCINRQLVCLAA